MFPNGPLRCRMVTIRLAEEEFQQVRAFTKASGAASVSEFTRAAIHALLNGNRHASENLPLKPVEHRFASVHARLQAIECRLERIKENLNGH